MARHNAPAQPITGPVFRLIIRFTFFGQLIENVLDYQASTNFTMTGTLLADAIASWQSSVTAAWIAMFSPQNTALTIIAQDVSQGVAPTQVVVLTTTGSTGSVSLGSILAMVIQKNTNLKGASGRGRMSFSGIPSSFVTPATNPDSANAAAQTQMATLNTALMAGLSAGGHALAPCVCTRPVAPAYLVTHAQPITSFTLDTLFGTVRRRKEGRGQ
jgi:hypothetical protein